MGQSEAAAYETAVAKKPLDLAGRRICRNVEILGDSPQKQVADATSRQVGDEAVVMEPVERAQRVRADLLPGYAVFLSGNDAWFHGFHHSTPG